MACQSPVEMVTEMFSAVDPLSTNDPPIKRSQALPSVKTVSELQLIGRGMADVAPAPSKRAATTRLLSCDDVRPERLIVVPLPDFVPVLPIGVTAWTPVN